MTARRRAVRHLSVPAALAPALGSAITLSGSAHAAQAFTCEGVPMPAGYHLIVGTSDSNYLIGTPGNDFVVSGIGNDYVDAGSGHNTVYGGGGSDYIVG